MKKFLTLALSVFFAFMLFLPNQNVKAQENLEEQLGGKVEYILFHLETCPHCRDEIKFINKKLLPKYGEFIDLKMYEVTEPENSNLFRQYGSFYNTEVGSVPMAFIDGKIVQGYGTDKTTGKQIMNLVEERLRVRGLLAEESGEVTDKSNFLNLPLIGEFDPKSISLPFLTIVLGLLDGFNPCAMWILLFLISLLFGMENKKKMWFLGSLFIFISGVSYFVFMSAWLNLILFIGFIAIIRILIGLLAVGVGGFSIRDYWKNRKVDGVVCKVSKNGRNQRIMEKIKNIVHRKSLWWSVVGISLLAFSVNLVELACSAGFPAVFTQVLAINDIAMWQRYLYMFGYIFFYMFDDMVIFALAMITLHATGIGTKYAKFVNLFSGILIFILGLLLIFKPEWLMFT